MPNAIRFHETGRPEVLKLEAVDVGDPEPGEARVRHSYIAVNFIDVYFRTGRYPLPLPNGLGSDAVGVVEAVGPGVTEVRVGDRVGYLLGPQGAYADVRNMPAEVLIPLPDAVSDRTASTLMMKGMTAQYLFRQVYPLKGGETIKRIFGRLKATLHLRDAVKVGMVGERGGWGVANVEFTDADKDSTEITQTFRVLAAWVKEDAGWRIVQTQWSNAR